jgi:transposase
MLQLTSQMRILVAIEPVDFRNGIDGLIRLCKEVLGQDPFQGTVFAFRNRRGTAVKVLLYDGQGFWLAHKRLSEGRFRWWPAASSTRLSSSKSAERPVSADQHAKALAAHQLQVLLCAGDPENTKAAPSWRPVVPA